ncbi:hypothetical protein H920_15583 [Fukomys damarensis]|uniref:Uncharacterized protein n=1 Tax=Fukomys damarensis TaxID=885580 RepID=A0A091DJQ9_FUKDA|nr:hypothetical protein H920_15583 [Fukomys damarensis]
MARSPKLLKAQEDCDVPCESRLSRSTSRRLNSSSPSSCAGIVLLVPSDYGSAGELTNDRTNLSERQEWVEVGIDKE